MLVYFFKEKREYNQPLRQISSEQCRIIRSPGMRRSIALFRFIEQAALAKGHPVEPGSLKKLKTFRLSAFYNEGLCTGPF